MKETAEDFDVLGFDEKRDAIFYGPATTLALAALSDGYNRLIIDLDSYMSVKNAILAGDTSK